MKKSKIDNLPKQAAVVALGIVLANTARKALREYRIRKARS